MKIFYYLFLIIFFPRKFTSDSTKDVIRKEFESNKELLSSFPNRQLPQSRENELRESMEDIAKLLRAAIIKSFCTIVITMGLAVIIGFLSNLFQIAIHKRIVNLIRLFSACLLFVSVWGKLESEIQSSAGDTLPEMLNKKWSKYLFLSGNFLLILSYFL